MKILRFAPTALACLLAVPACFYAQAPATTLDIQGPAGQLHLSLEQLQRMPQTTVTVHNGHSGATESFTGVPLIDLLGKVGAVSGDAVKGKALSEYIVATGSDGYKAVLSLAEAEPHFHPGQVLVADSAAGKPLPSKQGPFKLVVSEDLFPARAVHNLVRLELVTAR